VEYSQGSRALSATLLRSCNVSVDVRQRRVVTAAAPPYPSCLPDQHKESCKLVPTPRLAQPLTMLTTWIYAVFHTAKPNQRLDVPGATCDDGRTTARLHLPATNTEPPPYRNSPPARPTTSAQRPETTI